MANDSACVLSDWYRHVTEKTYFCVYFVVTPSYFILGITGHILCVIAFSKQVKHDAAYVYQIFSSVTEILEIITFTLFISSFYWWSGAESQGAHWFMSDYGCMWYAAHLATPLVNMLITTSMFMSLSTTADRMYALVKPFSYKNANHKRHKIAAFSSSYILGVSTSIFDCFRFHLSFNREMQEYKLSVDEIYVASLTAMVLAQLRNAVRVLGLLALITSNTILICAYRKHNRQVGVMIPAAATRGGVDHKEIQRRLREKTLMTLTICDSVLTTVGMTLLIAYYAAVYISPTFTTCEGLLAAPVLDGTLQITEIANFYIVFAASKQFRQMIGSTIPAFCSRALRLGQFKTAHHGTTKQINASHNTHSSRRRSFMPPAVD